MNILLIKKKVRSSGACRKRGSGIYAPTLGEAHTIRTGFSYKVRVQVRKAPVVRCDMGVSGDSGRLPTRCGRRNAEVSRVTRVSRPPVVQKETWGDSGDSSRSPTRHGRRNVEVSQVSQVTRVSCPPIVKKEKQGDSGDSGE